MSDQETDLDIVEAGTLSDETAEEPQAEVAPEETEEAVEETADQETEETEEESQEEEAPKPRRRNRTAKLAAKLSNAEQQIQALTQRLEALQQPPPAEDEPSPKMEDFGKYEDYVAAHAAHVARQESAKVMQNVNSAIEKASRNIEVQQKLAAWNQREAQAREKYEDYDDVVHPDDLPITEDMATAIFEMEDGTDVAYHLGRHPSEIERISKLSPVAQTIELGRIASRLAAPRGKPTSAPTPVKTVKSGSAPQGLTPYTARSFDDYVKARSANKG